MAEDKIDSYIDRDGIKGDTKFLLDEINTAYEAIKKYNAQKPSLDAAKGYEAAATAIKKQKDSQDELAASSAKLNDAANRTAKSLQDTVATINATKASNEKLSGSYDDLIKASVANQVAAKGLAQARKELDLSFKQGIISADDYTNILADIKKKEVEITVSNLDLNRAIRNTEKGFQSVEGSTNAMRAELNLALQAFDRLSEADKGSEFGVKLKADINELTDKIKVQEEGTQRFQRNVGNYQGSAKIIVDALSAVEKKMGDLKEKQTQLNTQAAKDPVGFKFGKGAEQLNQVNAALATTEKEFNALNTITESPKFFNLAAKTGDARTEIRGFTTALVELERKGLGSSDFAVEMRKHLAELTDQVADTKDEIKALSSDSRSFDQLSSSVTFLANSYQTVVGVQALFGDQSEATEETIKKLVAVQAVANGLQEISEQLTKRGTIVNRAYTIVQGQYAIATDASAAATVRLSAATKLLLGGLIIGALAFIVIKLTELSQAADKAAEGQRRLSEVTAQASGKVADMVTTVNDLKEKLKLAKEGLLDKAKVLKEYNEKLGGTVGETNNLNTAEKTLLENGDKIIKLTFLKAQASAAAALAGEALKKSIEDGAKSETEFVSTGDMVISTLKNIGQQFNPFVGQAEILSTGGLKLLKVGEDNKKKQVKQEEDKYKVFTDLQKMFTDEAAAYAKTHKLNFFDDPGGGGKKGTKDLENELKARFELEKINQQKIIDLHKTIADSEGIPQNVRIAERLQQFEAERALILMQQDFELSNTKLTQSEKLLIIENSEKSIRKAESDAAIGVIAIRKQVNDQIKEDAEATNQWSQDAIHKQTEDQIKAIYDGLEARVNAIEKEGDAEIKAALEAYTTGKINKEQYEEQKLAIENEIRKKSLLAEIAYQKLLIDVSNQSPEAKAAAKKRLAELERQINEMGLKAAEDSANKLIQIEAKKNAKLKELKKELVGLAEDIFTGGIDRQKNQIQEQIDALEAKKQKDIEVATQSIANEQQRAAAISTIEARAAAERERLERRKRQLDQERAKYERIKNIADIIQSTAVAVVGALGAKPWGPQNIALAAIVGAIGAAQIARVIATPIPKFYGGKSRENKYEGQAIVGDGGRQEAIIREGGKVEITPNTPTQTWVGRNDVIIPDARQLIEHDFKLAISNTGKLMNASQPKQLPAGNSDVVRGLKSLERTVKNKREVIIKGMSKRDLIMKYGYSWQKYLND
jgi:hypothetical protein